MHKVDLEVADMAQVVTVAAEEEAIRAATEAGLLEEEEAIQMDLAHLQSQSILLDLSHVQEPRYTAL